EIFFFISAKYFCRHTKNTACCACLNDTIKCCLNFSGDLEFWKENEKYNKIKTCERGILLLIGILTVNSFDL
ncbi:MAG: hypothetical protein ABIU11_07305, partial [Chitinophagaceae bacterium]